MSSLRAAEPMPVEPASFHKRPHDEITAGLATSATPLRQRARRPEPVVGDILSDRWTAVCSASTTLADAVDIMTMHDRTAAAVIDDAGALLGMLTENDILHAYSMGALPTCGAGDWLCTRIARLPPALLDALTVRPSCTLRKAAAMLRAQALGDSAFRHLVVRDGDGQLVGILSVLDLARALCIACPDEGVVARNTAVEMMKPRSALPVCSSDTPLLEVLRQMSSSKQNCVLIADGKLSVSDLLGVVTPRDAFRAFVEHVPLSVQVGPWLRGLQSDWEPRAVEMDETAQACARRMADHSLHHLVVVSPAGVAGVVSSTDLAQALGAAADARSGAPHIVGDIVGLCGTVTVGAAATLADVVDLVTLYDRSAAACIGDDGALWGVLTENDIVRAYSVGALPTSSVGDWFSAHAARLPEELLDTLTVRPSSTLLEAAAILRAQALGDAAFRHLVVRGSQGQLLGVLSALDLARALCSVSRDDGVVGRVARSTADEMMKPRSALPVCSSETPLLQVLRQLDASRQNCVLIADGELAVSGLLGVVTPRDAMRAFVEHVPVSVQVGLWLHGLQSDWAPRAVDADDTVQACARRMVEHSLHHLVVVSSAGVAGVMSSTDLAHAIGSPERMVDGCGPTDEVA